MEAPADALVYCGMCRFWKQKTEAPPVGECRRYAPRPYNGPGSTIILYPYTNRDDWCGDGRIRLTE